MRRAKRGTIPAITIVRGTERRLDMKKYEVLIQTIRPCGGDIHEREEFSEVQAESPEAYVRERAAYPILDLSVKPDGDTIVTTGDGKGNFVKYTFSK